MKYILSARFFTIPETAKMLSVHPTTVKGWIRKGSIEAVRIGRERHISEQQLEYFLRITKPVSNAYAL